MKETMRLSWPQAMQLAEELYDRIEATVTVDGRNPSIWGVPRGGQHVVGLLASRWEDWLYFVDRPEIADIAVDDIIDSGRTALRVKEMYGLDTLALVTESPFWVEMPWEVGGLEADASDIVVRMLQQIGEDPQRDGLIDTPRRVVESWAELYGGYDITEPAKLLKTFELPELHPVDENRFDPRNIVQANAIAFTSTCEHHMLPFSGTVDVAYVPDLDKGVIGLSKIPRVVDAYARRLQVQERLTAQIADAVKTVSESVRVRVKAQHSCLVGRGAQQRETEMITHTQRGPFPLLFFDWTHSK